jgi:hypothetical protein
LLNSKEAAIGASTIGCSILNRSNKRRSGHIGVIPVLIAPTPLEISTNG